MDTRMVNLQILVVFCKSIYHCIIGRSFAETLDVVASPIHLKMKYHNIYDEPVTYVPICLDPEGLKSQLNNSQIQTIFKSHLSMIHIFKLGCLPNCKKINYMLQLLFMIKPHQLEICKKQPVSTIASYHHSL